MVLAPRSYSSNHSVERRLGVLHGSPLQDRGSHSPSRWDCWLLTSLSCIALIVDPQLERGLPPKIMAPFWGKTTSTTGGYQCITDRPFA